MEREVFVADAPEVDQRPSMVWAPSTVTLATLQKPDRLDVAEALEV